MANLNQLVGGPLPVAIVLMTMIAIVSAGPVAEAERPVIADTIADVETQLRSDVAFLASDELGGRDVSNETIHQAADYIADRMNRIGLDTKQINDGPFQDVEIPLGARAGAVENNAATFTVKKGDVDQTYAVKLKDGMNPLALGAETGAVQSRLVFVGYGITAPKLNYDDYAGIDVQGATVMLLRKEPGFKDPNSPFDGLKTTRHAYFASKVDNAVKHGAAGVMILNDPESTLKSVQNQRSKIAQEQTRKKRIQEELKRLPPEAKNSRATFEKKLISIDRMVASLQQELKYARRGVIGVSEAGGQASKKTIPVMSLARDVADELLVQSTGQSLSSIEKAIDSKYQPNSGALPGTATTWKIELQPTKATSSNVIGVLPGRGVLADQTVVIGGHYDHVGMGGYGSLAPGTIAVHNGADDNASGTATLLGSAAILMQSLRTHASHRRIVFVAFTGEERGLLGSNHYVKHAPFAIDSTVAMINLDMVGRLRDNELTIYGTGSADVLSEIIDQSNARYQFDIFRVKTGYGPSDHQSFYKAGVPVLFFFTGLHNDYHRPTDDSDKLEYASMARITQMVADVGLRLAVLQERPVYAETEKKVQIRRQLTAYIGVTLSDRGDHVVFSTVNDGGPGERAGLQMGDRVDRMGRTKIRTSRDVLEFLRGRSPGQTVKIRILRDGVGRDVNIKLGVRPQG